MDINVEYYQTGTGRSPVQEFLDSLNPKMHDKMKLSIGLLKEHGIHLRAPYSKPIRDGLFELRARIGTNLSRIVYYWNSKCSVVFLCGFIKKDQKLSTKELMYFRQLHKMHTETDRRRGRRTHYASSSKS